MFIQVISGYQVYIIYNLPLIEVYSNRTPGVHPGNVWLPGEGQSGQPHYDHLHLDLLKNKLKKCFFCFFYDFDQMFLKDHDN